MRLCFNRNPALFFLTPTDKNWLLKWAWPENKEQVSDDDTFGHLVSG